MDAEQIRSLRPKLRKLLAQFDDCFLRSDEVLFAKAESNSTVLVVVIQGQLGSYAVRIVREITFTLCSKHQISSTKHQTNANDERTECSKRPDVVFSAAVFENLNIDALNVFEVWCLVLEVSQRPNGKLFVVRS